MGLKNYICGGGKFVYSKGYIGLPIVVDDLPEIVEIDGNKLYRKSSFHISLVCVKDILVQNPDVEQTIVDAFCTFAGENDISFVGYTGEFRFAQHEDKKTLVALCEVSNLKTFSEMISNNLGIKIPAQPTHVTLFTLQPDIGIGLNSDSDMEAKSKKVTDELSDIVDLIKKNI